MCHGSDLNIVREELERMSNQTRIETLRSLDFFSGVAEHDLQELVKLCHEVDFPARTIMFEEHQPAKDVYFIVRGEVSLAICDPTECRQFAVVAKGELLGWSPLLGRSRLSDTARTLTTVKAVVIDGGTLLDFCKTRPEFGFEFMRRVACVLGQRLTATRFQMLELCGVHFPKFSLESD